MNGKTLTLIGILVFVLFVIGTFVMFIGKWNSGGEAAASGVRPAKTEERQA